MPCALRSGKTYQTEEKTFCGRKHAEIFLKKSLSPKMMTAQKMMTGAGARKKIKLKIKRKGEQLAVSLSRESSQGSVDMNATMESAEDEDPKRGSSHAKQFVFFATKQLAKLTAENLEMASQVYVDKADTDESDITNEKTVDNDNDHDLSIMTEQTTLTDDLQLSLSEDEKDDSFMTALQDDINDFGIERTLLDPNGSHDAPAAPMVTVLKPENVEKQEMLTPPDDHDGDDDGDHDGVIDLLDGCTECQFLRQDLKTRDREIEAKTKELQAKDKEIETLKEEKEEFRMIASHEVRKKTEEKDAVIRNLQLKIDKLERAYAKLEEDKKSLQLANMNMTVAIQRMQTNDVTEREERRERELEERKERIRRLEELMTEEREKLHDLENNDDENNDVGSNRVSQSRKRPVRPSCGDSNSNGVQSQAKLPRQ